MPARTMSDEHYVIDLCDEVLRVPALRHHTFDWLRGDPSPKTGNRRVLPVDAYWPHLGLVVEYMERQHTQPVRHFDKPDVMTVSGVSRGEQRKIYDERKHMLPRERGLIVLDIPYTAFGLRRRKIDRNRQGDRETVRVLLAEVGAV